MDSGCDRDYDDPAMKRKDEEEEEKRAVHHTRTTSKQNGHARNLSSDLAIGLVGHGFYHHFVDVFFSSSSSLGPAPLR